MKVTVGAEQASVWGEIKDIVWHYKAIDHISAWDEICLGWHNQLWQVRLQFFYHYLY